MFIGHWIFLFFVKYLLTKLASFFYLVVYIFPSDLYQLFVFSIINIYLLLALCILNIFSQSGAGVLIFVHSITKVFFAVVSKL